MRVFLQTKRFNSLVKMYYQDVQCGIVVFDVTNSRALNRLNIWLQPLKEGAVKNAVLILVANKIDGERSITTEDGTKFAEEHNMLYAETSAATGMGVEAAFYGAFEELIKRVVDDKTIEYDKKEDDDSNNRVMRKSKAIALTTPTAAQSAGGGWWCC
eukprot:TRINITY_DN228_c0_g1_i2.p1 TRINITY_DN228_c0_g1~~TRINITY_DN228_c0_g1_i2.p1  ORF type:complete len:157 (-),score=41.89 TRINITY_DN228_c0_g1_i2:728-1198(-)